MKSPPCHDEELSSQLAIQSECQFIKNISRNYAAFYKLMKFSKQSPTFSLSEEDLMTEFGSLTENNYLFGFYPKQKLDGKRYNAFVALCRFEEYPEEMTFESCDLFRRSFTNLGLGYTFNNEEFGKLFKKSPVLENQSRELFLNKNSKPKMIKSANSEHGLTVILESNMEQIERFENTKSTNNPEGDIPLKPKPVQVVIHHPSEPANVKSKSFLIPLGHSTTVYITPRATITDTSAQKLSEEKRDCRMRRESTGMNIFQQYSREACLLECQINHAVEVCGCNAWDYPLHVREGKNLYLCDSLGRSN